MITRRRRVGIALLCIVLGGFAGSSAAQVPEEPARSAGIPAADRPPMSLLQVGQAATELFDAAWSSDWRRSGEDLQSLVQAASGLPDDLPRPDLVAQLQSNITSVSAATNAKQRIQIMDAANAITQIVAELSAQYLTVIPYDVKMLGYYGRQIEVGIASGRTTDSTQALSNLVTVWNRVEPAMTRRGDGAAARGFSDLIVALMSAKQPNDFLVSVSAELAAASRLERIFTLQQ
jgi:hypothetical protein